MKNLNTKQQNKQEVEVSAFAETSLAPAEPSFLDLSPQELLARGRKAKEKWQAYQMLVQELREPGDFVSYRSRGGKLRTLHTKRWIQKLMVILGISYTTTVVSFAGDEDDQKTYVVLAEVWMGNRRATGLGACAPIEFIKRGEKTRAKAFALATAETRAINRAVQVLLGLREISAEEVSPTIAVRPPEEIPEVIPSEEGEPVFELSQEKPQNSFKRQDDLYTKKYRLIEEIIQQFGEETAEAKAKEMFRVPRLADLGVPQLEAVKKALSSPTPPAEQERPQVGKAEVF